ncbi:MAG: hypothetical protein J6Z49_09640 [Kiritimatiellae bacterium]|nr:hypothetical protein [Kiritimatiellia bacterium]
MKTNDAPAIRLRRRKVLARGGDAELAWLAEFPDPLSGAEAAALTNFLSVAESRIPGVAPRDALSLKNDAADALAARAPGGSLLRSSAPIHGGPVL